MKVKIEKIGADEGFLLPRGLVERHNLKVGETLKIVEEDGKLVLEFPSSSDKQNLQARSS
jgi:antitoxin component of MazEF toxin-antitoxin module